MQRGHGQSVRGPPSVSFKSKSRQRSPYPQGYDGRTRLDRSWPRNVTVLNCHSPRSCSDNLFRSGAAEWTAPGWLEQLEAPQAICQRPDTGFAARFLGPAAFLPALVRSRTADGERVEIETSGGPRAFVDVPARCTPSLLSVPVWGVPCVAKSQCKLPPGLTCLRYAPDDPSSSEGAR